MSARLANGLTPEQDAAFDRLARAIADHLTDPKPCDCLLHPKTLPGGNTAPGLPVPPSLVEPGRT